MGKIYDVAVIGAGPAGASAAKNSAQLGLETILLEEHTSIGEPVHCGECLSEYATQNIGIKLPKEVISLDVKGVKVIFPDGTDRNVSEPGYVLEKHLFEQWLASEAEKLGAYISLDSKVTELERRQGLWNLKAKDKEIQAKIVIDASGVQAVTSRFLGINQRFQSVVGMQYEMQEVETTGYLDFYLWPELAPEGYLWVIPKCNQRSNVGLVTTQMNKAKTYLDQFTKRIGVDGKKINKTFGGMIPASGPLKNTFAEGLMLVGDAAGFTSPLFEGGTQLSLKSGQFAAQVAKQAVEKNDLSAEQLSQYKKLWFPEFPNYEKLIDGREKLYKFSDVELSQMAKIMPMELGTLSFFQKINVGFNVLIKHPHFFKKGFMPAMQAFEYSRAKFYGW
ncbi:MAG: NAD(P)/FAD-dependent oxidoreductase [Candidatus Diapherotrites archaeon]|nr:NAD(P)/FAD-dependent oxidoreductase [Candidatus Diapherotrites archaeon]